MKKGQVYSPNIALLICFYLTGIYEEYRGLLIGFLCEKGKDKFHQEKPLGFSGFLEIKKYYIESMIFIISS